MDIVARYKNIFDAYLQDQVIEKEPIGLYEPVHYIMNLGGKRLRPVLALWACDLLDGSPEEALPMALALEVFHNFTLVHDDIMDNATLRRGKKTVHEKWNSNTGILSGDVMLILAYKLLENYEGAKLKHLLQVFNRMAVEVCEGQQMDMDFETMEVVSIDAYLAMITLKTSVLIGTALQMGAIVAGSDLDTGDKLFEFGKNLGLAFQLQDDFLDTFGTQATFGKKIGGDIEENKKTFLYLKAMDVCDDDDRDQLIRYYTMEMPPMDKVAQVTMLFRQYDIQGHTLKEIQRYTENAFEILDELNLPASEIEGLREFGSALMKRTM